MERLEDNLQKAVATYLGALNMDWCHVPNEGQRHVAVGARLKAKGMKAGVPDCLIFNKTGEYSGLAIELKIKGRKQTDPQKEWQVKLINCGWAYEVAYSIDEVIKLMNLYYGK